MIAQCATITKSFKSIVSNLHEWQRQWCSAASNGNGIAFYPSILSRWAKVKNGQCKRWNDKSESNATNEKARRRQMKRVCAFNISRKSTQSSFISCDANSPKSAHVSLRTRADSTRNKCHLMLVSSVCVFENAASRSIHRARFEH